MALCLGRGAASPLPAVATNTSLDRGPDSLPKREKEAGSWRILHKEELHNLYASQSIIRVIIS